MNSLKLLPLFFLLLLVSCYEPSEEEPALKDIIELTVSPDSDLQADGTTQVTLTAKVPVNADDKFRTVTFKASNGKLLGIESDGIAEKKVVDRDSLVIIHLQLPQQSGNVFVSATIGSDPIYRDESTLHLATSYPDTLIIEPASTMVELNSSLILDIFLRREGKKVSEGVLVDGSAFQQLTPDSNRMVGRFTGLFSALSGMDQKTQLEFVADTEDIDPELPVIIRCFVQNEVGQVVADTRISVKVKDQ